MRYALLVLFAVAPARLSADDPPPDPLPNGVAVPLGGLRFQGQSIGRSLAFSPDGKKLATAGNNGPVSVWDAATGKLLRTHAPVGSVYDVRWTPEGKLVALAFFQGNGAFMHEWADGPDTGPTAERIRELAAAVAGKPDRKADVRILSEDGRRVVGVRNPYDANRTAEVFAFAPNTPTALAEPERSIPLGTGSHVWLSRDGKTLLAHGSGKKVGEERLAAFDLTAKDADKPAWELALPAPSDHRVTQCLSADGKRVVLAFLNGDVEVWDGPGGKLVRHLYKALYYYLADGGESPAIALSPDGKRVAMISREKNGEVGGWVSNVDTDKGLVKLAPGSMPRLGWGRAFSPDGTTLAVAGAGAVRVWDSATGADASPSSGHRGRINSVVASPDGKTVVTAGDDLTVRGWDPATGKEKWKATFPQVVGVSFVTGGAVVVEGANVAEPLLDLATGKAKLLPGEMGKGRKLPAGAFANTGVTYDQLIAVAPDGKSAVTADSVVQIFGGGLYQSSLRVWSWPTGELKNTLALDVPKDFYATRVRGRFTPDGKELRTATWCRLQQPPPSGPVSTPVLIDRWDTATGKRLERKETRDVYPVWTADGSRLLVVRDAGKIEEAFTGKTAGQLPHHNTDPFSVWTLGGMALSPDGKRIAIGGDFAHPGSVRVCDVQSGYVKVTLPAGGRGRLEVAFLPDGRLVTAGESAIVWSADAAETLKPPKKP